MVEVGEIAPDFTLEGAHEQEVREFTLSEFAGQKPTALVFYVYDYSPVCTTQMCEVNDMEFLTFNDDVSVLGISTDGPYSHREFASDNGLTYPLLSDPQMKLYREYGLTEKDENGDDQAKRGVVLLGSDRTVQYRWEANDNWDEWRIDPLNEMNDIVDSLLG